MRKFTITYMVEGSQKQFKETREAVDGRHVVHDVIRDVEAKGNVIRRDTISYQQMLDM